MSSATNLRGSRVYSKTIAAASPSNHALLKLWHGSSIMVPRTRERKKFCRARGMLLSALPPRRFGLPPRKLRVGLTASFVFAAGRRTIGLVDQNVVMARRADHPVNRFAELIVTRSCLGSVLAARLRPADSHTGIITEVEGRESSSLSGQVCSPTKFVDVGLCQSCKRKLVRADPPAMHLRCRAKGQNHPRDVSRFQIPRIGND